MSSPVALRGFVDESLAARAVDRQEYLVGAALVTAEACDEVRDRMRGLLLPGQVKLHWTDESPARRRNIISQICELKAMNVVVTHLDERRAKTERFRRKCLETLYHEMVAMDEPLLWIADAVLGAINSDHRGERQHLAELTASLVLRATTPDSIIE